MEKRDVLRVEERTLYDESFRETEDVKNVTIGNLLSQIPCSIK